MKFLFVTGCSSSHAAAYEGLKWTDRKSLSVPKSLGEICIILRSQRTIHILNDKNIQLNLDIFKCTPLIRFQCYYSQCQCHCCFSNGFGRYRYPKTLHLLVYTCRYMGLKFVFMKFCEFELYKNMAVLGEIKKYHYY